MKRCRRWILFSLMVFFLGNCLVFSVSAEVRAEEAGDSDTRYLIYLDDTEFEVTREDYIILSELQGSPALMYTYLSVILGDRMPEDFSRVSGRVVRGSNSLQPDPAAPDTSAPGATMPAATGRPDLDGQDPSAGENEDFIIRDGRLISYRGSDPEVRIPDGVTSIQSLAFYRNDKVKSICIPSSVKRIGNGAFYRCQKLKFIRFDSGNITLAENFIGSCDRLTNLTAPRDSKVYKYAQKNDIPVATSSGIQLDRKKLYLVQGDVYRLHVYNSIYAAKWKSGKSRIFSVSSNGKGKAKKSGRAVVTATVNGKKYSCRVKVVPRGIDTRIRQVVQSEIKSGMNRYEKVKAVHDWMIRNIKYDYYRLLKGYQYVPKVSHTARGALVKKVAVCDGYAHAFGEIMKKLKIPCKFVTGRHSGIGHAWNMVKLGGKWYHIDVTFDDPIVNESNANTTPYYTYFLKSTATMKKTHHFQAGNYPKCVSKKYE